MRAPSTTPLPGHWTEVTLGDVATFLSGFAFSSAGFNTDGNGLPLARIRDVKRGRSGTFFDGPFNDRFVIDDGDVLIGMDGEFNLARWRGGRALLNQRVCRLSEYDPRLVDARYVVHFLPIALGEIEAMTPFATVKHLSTKALAGTRLPLPPLEEQRRIADVLDRADALRAKRRETLARLDELTEAMFADTFGDVVQNSRGWPESCVLGEVAELGSGITKGRRIPEGTRTFPMPYLAVANVQDRRLDLAALKVIEATEDELGRMTLRTGDLLLTEGGDPDKLGRGCVWNGEVEGAIFQNHLFRVRLRDDAPVTPFFLMWLVSSTRGKRYFLRAAKQTTGIATINRSQLRQFPLLLPPLALQLEFEAAVARVHGQPANAQLDVLDELFASLQQRAFRGDLFSSPLPAELEELVG